MPDGLTRMLLTLMPKHSFSLGMQWLSDLHLPKSVQQKAIRTFANQYSIDLDEVEKPLSEYATFDEFFTRRLKPGARIVDSAENALVSPCDGFWSNAGRIEELQLEQIKGKRYRLDALLGGEDLAEPYADGGYATLYLSPKDYHRVHFPCDGRVVLTRYIPGRQFPVNAPSVRTIEELFSRNERMVTVLETSKGLMAIVMVAATCVSRITQSYDPTLAAFDRKVGGTFHHYPAVDISKGDELGIFHLGSTVILAFPEETLELENGRIGAPLTMGERIATW